MTVWSLIANDTWAGLLADVLIRSQVLGHAASYIRRDSREAARPGWYRIPESRQASGGFRLSTVVTVGYGRLQWVPASLRVRLRVQSQSLAVARIDCHVVDRARGIADLDRPDHRLARQARHNR